MISARALLDELTALELRPAISILMETHRAGREIGQDWIRLKNLLRAVDHQLDARGLALDDAARLLEPAHALVDERAFWRQQEDGLAVYAAPNFFRTYHCPQRFREMAVVSDRFHVTQLFPLLSADLRFYVLALSQKDVRLIEATRTSAVELDLGDLPRSLTEALMTEPPGQELQHHVVSAVGVEHGAMFHGHGVGGLEHRKEEIRQFFHQLDRGLHPFLKKGGALRGVHEPRRRARHPGHPRSGRQPHIAVEIPWFQEARRDRNSFSRDWTKRLWHSAVHE